MMTTARVVTGSRRVSLRRILLACLLIVLAVGTSEGRRVPDRDATVVLIQGMLVTVDHATFYQDGGIIELRVRNSTYEITRARVRIVVLDDRLRLRGSVSYCTGILQPGTRQPVLIPLEVKDASVRDRFVVYVEEVLTPRRRYSLREPLSAALGQARKAVDQLGAELTTVEEPRTGPIPDCPCECEDAERLARDACADAGPQAFTCTPMLPGCSHGLTCHTR